MPSDNPRPRPLPRPTPETQHFWDGTLGGELLLQRCEACAHVYFPPRPFCAKCSSREVEVFAATGKATLYSYIINQRSTPGHEAPYSIAVVELEEGPRMMTNIVGCDQTEDALELDMALEVTYEQLSDTVALPTFTPVVSA